MRGQSHAARGPRVRNRRFWVLLATTVFAVGGTYTAYTYVSAFLTRVSSLPLQDVPRVLFLSGLASSLGVVCISFLVGRRPWFVATGPVGLLVLALFGLYVFGNVGTAAAGLQALEGFGLASLSTSMQTRVLTLAPGSTSIASAWYAAVFNVGVAAGPAIGGFALSNLGLRGTPLLGGILEALALAMTLGETLVSRFTQRCANRA